MGPLGLRRCRPGGAENLPVLVGHVDEVVEQVAGREAAGRLRVGDDRVRVAVSRPLQRSAAAT